MAEIYYRILWITTFFYFSVESASRDPIVVPLKKVQGQPFSKNVFSVYYTATITVGEPAQTFEVLLNTRDADIWISSSIMCATQSKYCDSHSTYNHKKSSSYIKSKHSLFLYNDFNEYVEGDLAYEHVSIRQIKIKNQVFGEASSIYESAMNAKYDGTFGLGTHSDFHYENVDPPIKNMISQKLIPQPVFSVYLKKCGSNRQPKLVLGGEDHSCSSEFKFVPNYGEDNYAIPLDTMTIGELLVSADFYDEGDAGPSNAILDTATTGIGIPERLLEIITNNTNASRNEADEMYYVDCNEVSSLPTITFKFEDHVFPMRGSDYVVKYNYPGEPPKCWIGFFGRDSDYTLVLGTTFMEKYNMLFDLGQNRIGISVAK